jgi:site-specific DNA recombinase
MNRYFGYIRVSKDPDQDKISPDIQRKLIERYATKVRGDLVEIYGDVDVPSAKIDLAGTWSTMAEDLQAGDQVITNTASRLGRDLRETLTRVWALDKIGVEVISLEGKIDRETAVGKYLFHNLLAIAQLINDQHSEQMRGMHAYKAERGEWHGGARPPLGYTFTPGSKKLEVCESEAAVVREIYRLRDEGWGIHAIVKELAARGTQGKYGRMNYTSVRSTLSNATYAGKRTHKGQVYEGLHEAIIDQDLWDRVQARNRLNGKQAGGQRYLLSGMLVCGDCGGRMKHWRTGNGTRRTFMCKDAKDFGGRMVTVEVHLAEQWVLEKFFKRVDEKRVEALKGRLRKRAPKRESQAEKLRRQLAQVETSLDRLVSDYYDHDEPLLTADQFRRKNAEFQGKRTGIATELRELEDRSALDNVVYLERALDFRDSWEGMTLDEQRELLRIWIEKVIVHPKREGMKKADPSRLEIVWK